MGKTKENNPLKYFNDQRENRANEMKKSLTKFQFQNSIPGVSNVKDVTAGVSFGNKTSVDAEGNKVENATPSRGLDIKYIGQDITTDGNRTFKTTGVNVAGRAGGIGVNAGYDRDSGFNAGASYDRGPFSVKGGYSKDSGFTGGVSYNRGPVKISFDVNQNKAPEMKTQKKGGSTRKKK